MGFHQSGLFSRVLFLVPLFLVSNAWAASLNVKDQGAVGDGVTDDTSAIVKAMKFAKANQIATVYFPAGTYLVKQAGIGVGVIPLLNGVSLQGAGSALSHIKLSGGRHNPGSLFYQAWWDEPAVSNVVIDSLDLNGNLALQTFDSSYQFSHALSINNGQNIEIKNSLFQSFRGDGVLFGDTFLPSQDLRSVQNVTVHDNEFFNIYREGALFCATQSASFYNNYVHGNGYLVGGVDIERHSVNETVTNVQVYNNKFDFRDGVGPVERGGPSVHYRRAVTMGFFYSGYPNSTVDGRSGGHKVYSNQIYQGQIDVWGHTDISLWNNLITNTYENITGVGFVTSSAIHVADPGTTQRLTGVRADGNQISSLMAGNGISMTTYTGSSANGNTISGTQSDAISFYNASGVIASNTIQNVGTVANPVAGINLNGNSSGLVVQYNQVTDTRSAAARTLNFAVRIGSSNNGSIAPLIQFNSANHVLQGTVSEYYYQRGYAELLGNVFNP